MKSKIIVDSVADLPKDILESLDISVVPLDFGFLGLPKYKEQRFVPANIPLSQFYDRHEKMDLKSFYENMRIEGVTIQTSAPSPLDFRQEIESNLESYKSIFVITISHILSSTYNMARNGLDFLKEGKIIDDVPGSWSTSYHGKEIYLIDSRIGSCAEGLIAMKAAQNAEKSDEEILETILNARDRAHIYGIVDNGIYIEKSGRLHTMKEKIGFKVGTAMGRKFFFTTENGAIVPASTFPFVNKNDICDVLLNAIDGFGIENYDGFVIHCDELQKAATLEEKIRGKYKIDFLKTAYAGPEIGGHTGPGTLGIAFLANK
jgi:DegV family protein with EDD domain